MSAFAAVSICRRSLVAVGLALVLPLSALGADNVPPETLDVKVFPDRYIAAGKPFVELAALEAWVRPILIREVWLDGCGPASGKQLMAVVERFQSEYWERMRIRTLPSEEAGCASAAAHAGPLTSDVVQRPADVEFLATDDAGRSILP
jgi:hypothetical protein